MKRRGEGYQKLLRDYLLDIKKYSLKIPKINSKNNLIFLSK
jgi:hypothetical protein